ncbi:hypothetical protein EST38_g4287 [Candolleomyces aberdarensis]|uniref:Glycosyltransferase 61 catalytic domain-containing protein n=1 Tax=Candolleomyces aberdarensis TaxID=2316362 RepID=A0A4Q2DN10_9AGAR|nr:hypothetical protein EST38_g4287 [Candolleomyces aberdarensis]
MTAPLRRRDQLRALVFSAIGFVFLLVLFTGREHIPIRKAISWRKPVQQDLPVPVNHNTDFEPDAGDAGSSASEEVPSSHSSLPHTNYLASTDEETTIPSTALASDPSVTIPAQTYGFTVFDKLYLRNGTFFVVTKDPKSMPPRERILSKGEAPGSPDEPATDEDLQFISPSQAKEHLGEFATVMKDTTIFIYDRPQFLPHYYHFWGEVIIGAWRVYSTLGLGALGLDRLPLPSRWVMPLVGDDSGWRDKAGISGPLMRLAFPGSTMEQAGQWRDWKKSGTSIVFERSMIVNRVSAHKSPLVSTRYKMISGTMNVTVPTGFWEPLRSALTRNLFGYVPEVKPDGKPLVPPPFKGNAGSRPIVTYISRQRTGRRLTDESHQGLVAALKELEEEGICTVRIPVLENLSLRDQLAEVASSTILVGVHGNGLTHQLWMPPSLRSAVFEIVMPPGYIFDYEILAKNMGHKHYMVRNDSMLTFGPGDWFRGFNIPEGFHSDHIPVHGPFVADLIRKRLTQPDAEVEE